MAVQDHFLHPEPQKQLKIAAISDRVLAFAFDFFLFSPLIHLSLSFLFRKIQILYISAPDSLELIVLAMVAGILAVAELILIQALCISKWGGTPGKLFLKLRVVSYPDASEPVTLAQALVRSFLWVVEVSLLFIPFLETMSHSQRRALHDRGAETMVITLKTQGDPGPHILERHFVRQFLAVFLFVVGAWMVFGLGKAYQLGLSGAFKKHELLESASLCPSVSEDSANRVDEALGLYLADAVGEDCVLAEADFALWTGQKAQTAWAQLAMAILNKDDKATSEAYLAQICSSHEDGEACRLAQAFKQSIKSTDSGRLESLGNSVTGRILHILSLESTSDYAAVQAELRSLNINQLDYFKIKHQLKAFWGLRQYDQARGLLTGGILSLAGSDRRDLASWMCMEELKQDCRQGTLAKACIENQAVVSSHIKEKTPLEESQVIWSWVKMRECRGSSEALPYEFSELLENKSGLRSLVEATVHDSTWPLAKREQVLRDLAVTQVGAVKRWALQEWIQLATSENSLSTVFDLLEGSTKKDLYWFENVVAAFRKAFQSHHYDLAVDFADLVGEKEMANFKLKKEHLVALFQTGDLARAKVLAKELEASPERRLPASVSEASAGEVEVSYQQALKVLRQQPQGGGL